MLTSQNFNIIPKEAEENESELVICSKCIAEVWNCSHKTIIPGTLSQIVNNRSKGSHQVKEKAQSSLDGLWNSGDTVGTWLGVC